ncbi:hypothetical protein BLSTO_05322 [Blastocystis sp. subtype 1]
MNSQHCVSFEPTLYVHNVSYSGVTLVNHLTYDKRQILPILMKRWRGPISTVLFIEEDQLRDVAVFILQQKRFNVIYSLYTRHTSSSSIPYVARKGKRVYYVNGIYPTNTLRNIGIESILTSHYLLLNIDTIPSINIYDSILENTSLLQNHKNVLLLPVFYSSRRVSQMVKVMKNYEELVKLIPSTKAELLKEGELRLYSSHQSDYIQELDDWMGEKGKNAYETQMTKLIEPNGVFRRSVMNPLFNSLFINECRNDYYYMWRLQNDGYSFSTLPQSFGVTLSLPAFTTKSNEEEEQELLSLYTYLINLI